MFALVASGIPTAATMSSPTAIHPMLIARLMPALYDPTAYAVNTSICDCTPAS